MPVVTVKVRQTTPTASEALIRSHRVPVDRPADKGGTDQGPMGGELFLAATAGCFMSNLLAAVRAREAPVAGVVVEAAGTLDQSPPRFTAVELRVTADCRDSELLEKLVDIAARGCIMVNTLRGTLDLQIRIASNATAEV